MALYLTVLGSSSATPTSSRHPSAFLLKSNKKKDFFLIDCGEGSQILMRRSGVHMQRISKVFISHLHGDHYFGLIGFIFTQNLLGRKEELHIYAHKPLEKIIKLQLKTDGTVLHYPLIFHAIAAHKKKTVLYEDSGIRISTFPLRHSITTNGFLFNELGQTRLIDKTFVQKHKLSSEDIVRIKAGNDFVEKDGTVWKNDAITTLSDDFKSFAYCSDTIYDEETVPHIEHVDLLYHEATFMQELESVAAEKFHSTAQQAAQIAVLAHAKRLLIGHYSARYKDIKPLLEEARTVFPETIAAFEGSTIKI
ncbi:MAG: ribonuclease Z [Bacteroidales bacterium]|jgi:ribonuclease Z|nr:ribonuclease Z [Bacteroidales bacterium]